MFDVGFTELLLIGVVSLVVIGPERLPDVARTVGKWIGKTQRFVRGVKTDIANELDSGELKKLIGDQRDQIDELRKIVGSTTRDIESSTRDAVRGARKKLTELEDAAARADGKADGEADADADVVRPSGPSTPPVAPAPTLTKPADGSASAAARTIGRRKPVPDDSSVAAGSTTAATAKSADATSGDAVTVPPARTASVTSTGAPDVARDGGASGPVADGTTDGGPTRADTVDDAARRTGSDS